MKDMAIREELELKKDRLQEAIRISTWDAKFEEGKIKRSGRSMVNTHAQTLEGLKEELEKIEREIAQLQ